MLLLDTTASDLIMQKMSIKLLACILTSLRVLSSEIYTFRTEYAGLIHRTPHRYFPFTYSERSIEHKHR